MWAGIGGERVCMQCLWPLSAMSGLALTKVLTKEPLTRKDSAGGSAVDCRWWHRRIKGYGAWVEGPRAPGVPGREYCLARRRKPRQWYRAHDAMDFELEAVSCIFNANEPRGCCLTPFSHRR